MIYVGQRYLYRVKLFNTIKSEVICEVQNINHVARVVCIKYIQIIKKGYLIDREGFIDYIGLFEIEAVLEFIYLEGQDKP